MERWSRPITIELVRELDRRDPLAFLRHRFRLPDGVVYLCGNSLGPPVKGVEERVARVVGEEWASRLVSSWNTHGWIDLHRQAAGLIAPLVGAGTDEVTVADSTSVNLFKLLSAALRLRPGRHTILTTQDNFPSDLYVVNGLAKLVSDDVVVRVVAADELSAALDEDVAVVTTSHVDFRTGAVHDLPALTQAARDCGALTLWDLSHSAGALEIKLQGWDVDLAVGCSYKYLSGGPGAPAYAFVARRLQSKAETPIQGWLGHLAPFEFGLDYEPATGIDRFVCGTPPILSLTALVETLGAFTDIDPLDLQSKARLLGDLFISLVDERLAGEVELASPRDPHGRGAQVSLRHPQGYAVIQALKSRGVVGDFRTPDLLRFGLAPSFVRFEDVYDAVEAVCQVLGQRLWDDPCHRVRAKVT